MSDRRATPLLSLALGMSLLIIWEAASRAHWISPIFLPGPMAVLVAARQMFLEQAFIRDIGISSIRIFLGFLLSSALAIPLGVLMGLHKRAESVVEPLVDFIRYTPIPAFIPLLILWFGIGELEKIMVIFASVFFQLVLMVANSLSRTPRYLIESAQTLGASPLQVISRVVLPYSQPAILDDLRVSMGWAWSGLMMAEIVGATSGIGFVIIQSQRLLQTPRVIAALVTVGILGVVTDILFKQFTRRQCPWPLKLHAYAQA